MPKNGFPMAVMVEEEEVVVVVVWLDAYSSRTDKGTHEKQSCVAPATAYV